MAPFTEQPPSATRRKLHLRRWLVLVTLAAFGYGFWKQHDYRSAVKEAEALGWSWHCRGLANVDGLKSVRKLESLTSNIAAE